MLKRLFLILIAIALLSQSCAKIFYSPDATAVSAGFWGSTNDATVSLSIHDYNANKMIWNYDNKLSTSMGSSARLVDDLMRQASREMPNYISMNSY